MTRFGGIASSTDIFAGQVRAGSVAFVAELTKSVVFSSTMPSANYRVSFSVEGTGLATAIGVQSKTANGFDFVAVSPITGTVGYMVVQDT